MHTLMYYPLSTFNLVDVSTVPELSLTPPYIGASTQASEQRPGF